MGTANADAVASSSASRSEASSRLSARHQIDRRPASASATKSPPTLSTNDTPLANPIAKEKDDADYDQDSLAAERAEHEQQLQTALEQAQQELVKQHEEVCVGARHRQLF